MVAWGGGEEGRGRMICAQDMGDVKWCSLNSMLSPERSENDNWMPIRAMVLAG